MANTGENGNESTPRPIVHVSEESRRFADLANAFTAIGSRFYEIARVLNEARGDTRMVLLNQLAGELAEVREAVTDAEIAICATKTGMP